MIKNTEAGDEEGNTTAMVQNDGDTEMGDEMEPRPTQSQDDVGKAQSTDEDDAVSDCHDDPLPRSSVESSSETKKPQGPSPAIMKDGPTQKRTTTVRRGSQTINDASHQMNHGYENSQSRTKTKEPVSIVAARDPVPTVTQQIVDKSKKHLRAKMNGAAHQREQLEAFDKKYEKIVEELRVEKANAQQLKKNYKDVVEALGTEKSITQQFIKTHDTSVEELKAQKAHNQQLVATHSRELQNREDSFKERLEQMRVERDDATKGVNQWQRQYGMSEQEHRKIQQKLESETRTAERKAQDLVKKFRTLQENAARNVESAQWMSQSATEVERQLNSTLGAIKQWSEKRMRISNSDATRDITTGRERRLLEDLKIVPVQDRHCPPISVSTKLVLSAAVSSYAFRNIIGDVFFAFCNLTKAKEYTDVYSNSSGEMLTTLIATIGKGDAAGANAWRCQLMRLLDPPPSNVPAIEDLKARTKQARGEATRMLAEKCLDQMYDLIQDPGSEQVLQELQAIFDDCAQLAKNLSVQKMEVKVVGIGQLSPTYEAGSTYLQPHGIHAADLEDDPRGLDGKRVCLLVNPAIVVHGTAAGGDYEQHRVWKKATVLIES